MGNFIKLVKTTFKEWSEDKAPRLAAALAYYTTFSLAPLLVIVIGISGLIFGQEAVRERLIGEIAGMAGQDSAAAVETMLGGAQETGTGWIATIIGIVTLLFGATGVFAQLQDAMNTMWEVEPNKEGGVMGIIRTRILSFGMILAVAFLLLVSLVVSALLSVFAEFTTGLFPGFEFIMQVINFIVAFAIITVLFAIIFKYVPDAEIAWRDVWLGAAVTAFLFVIGRWAIELYVGNTDFTSTYGAAGSIIVILLWVYYSAQILFLGAEFTQVYANMYGSRVVPSEHAQPISEDARVKQGIPHREREDVPAPESARPAEEGGFQTPRQAPAPFAAAHYGPEPVQKIVPPYTLQPGHREPQLLPEARPSVLAISTVLATLVGFLGGWAIRRGNRRKR